MPYILFFLFYLMFYTFMLKKGCPHQSITICANILFELLYIPVFQIYLPRIDY